MTVDEIKKKYGTQKPKSINTSFDFEITARYKTPLIKANDTNAAREKARKMAESVLKKNGFYDVKCILPNH